MSKGLVETITEFFNPQAPLWACELTSKHVIVAGVNSHRNRVASKSVAELPAGKNVEATRPLMSQILAQAGFKGSEIAVVVPDETARIAFLTAENLSSNSEERRTFIRWKLKKSLPFDVDSAQVAYRILGRRRGGTGVDLLVAVSPHSVVQEYETLFEALAIHAGMILPSTLAALNLFTAPASDALFVKIAPDCVTTTVFQGRRVQFYRRVTDVSLYDAVYPTVLYYQDKLGGTTFERLFVCGYDADLQRSLDDVQEKLGLAAERIGPESVEDIYKPALGAIHLKPVNSHGRI
ncbi:MAG: hypothetical protein DMG14_17535 [Acidobacteria bacterium]|nr:MAG: hypothetical protein DMG14_17535 [Acidobacteriota bacterium]